MSESNWNTLFNKPSNKDFYDFFMQLYAYLRSGNDVVIACSAIYKNTENKIFKQSLRRIVIDLENGSTFAEALAHNSIFPKYFAAVIRAGEESGTTLTVLKEITISLQQEMNIAKKVSTAFLPLKLSLGVFVFVFLYLSIKIIPKYEQMYAQKKLALPLITKMIFGFVDLINTCWYLLVLVVAAGFILAKWFLKKNPDLVDTLRLKIPYYKRVYFYLIQYRIASTFVTLHNAGFSVVDTLSHMTYILSSPVYKSIFKSTIRNIVNGDDFAVALRGNDPDNLIDPMIKNFTQTGELNNTLSEMLSEAREYFRNVIDDVLIWFSTYVTAIFLLPIAVMVLLVYIAILVPQIDLFQSLRMRG